MLVMNLTSFLQLEEDAVSPREGEVESRSAEERADDDQHCPEHEEERHHGEHEFAVFRLV